MYFETYHPANFILFGKYADDIKVERVMSHVFAKQAKPIFLGKFEKLTLNLCDQLS